MPTQKEIENTKNLSVSRRTKSNFDMFKEHLKESGVTVMQFLQKWDKNKDAKIEFH